MLFSGNDNLNQTSKYLSSLSFQKGFTLFNPQQTDNIFYIKSGQVKIVKEKDTHNEEFVINIAKPGDIIGLDHLFANKKEHTYSAKAISNGEAIRLSCADLIHLSDSNLKIRNELLNILCNHISFVEKRMLLLGRKKIKDRFIDLLFELYAGKIKQDCFEKITIEYSIDDLAHYMGTTRQYLYKVITELIKRKLLAYERKKLILINQNKLLRIKAGHEVL